jgi:hypothetical protein
MHTAVYVHAAIMARPRPPEAASTRTLHTLLSNVGAEGIMAAATTGLDVQTQAKSDAIPRSQLLISGMRETDDGMPEPDRRQLTVIKGMHSTGLFYYHVQH